MSGISGLAPGLRVGDYVLGCELPARSTTLAFDAMHVLLPRRVRLVIPAEGEVAIEVMREACILETLRHPGVPRIYECGVFDRRPWIAIESIRGPNIAALTAEQPLAVADVIALLRDVAAILDYAHVRGVLHRDIRPSVIVRGPNGLCITDWNNAVLDPTADGRGDVYALGVVAYAALTLELPTISAARRCPGAPARLTALIDRMLAESPHERPTSADVRAEATLLAELAEQPFIEDDGTQIEEVDVVLVDISHDPPPMPRQERLKWTPADSYTQRPPPPELDPRRKRT